MLDCENRPKKRLRKITKDRLKNIALYYLQRFETTTESLRAVLLRRVNDYAFYNPEFDKTPALQWIEEILSDCERFGYISDARFAELKIKDYLAAGKSARYIKLKLLQKGIEESLIENLLQEQEYNPEELAWNLAKKKKIGPFRQNDEERREYRQKDLATLVRAGFDYDVAQRVLEKESFD